MSTTSPLTGLDLQIATALQIDPRASWRRIAQVLQAPERSVARHGTALLEAGVVVVAGMRTRAETALLRVECAPGTARAAVESLSHRADSTFTYALTGGADCMAELIFDRGRMQSVLVNEVPGTVGMVRTHSYPVLRYFRTIRRWHSGALDDAQVAALTTTEGPELESMVRDDGLTGLDERIAVALAEDGRATVDALARRIGSSPTTTARRLSELLASSRLQVRALVEPALLGLEVEAILWITSAPGDVEHLGRALAEDPRVRYAAAVAGEYQVVADVTCKTNRELYALTTESRWVGLTQGIETTLVLQARKRGGRLMPWRD